MKGGGNKADVAGWEVWGGQTLNAQTLSAFGCWRLVRCLPHHGIRSFYGTRVCSKGLLIWLRTDVDVEAETPILWPPDAKN